MKLDNRHPASFRTGVRPTCLAVALALGTLSAATVPAWGDTPKTAEETFAAAMARHPGGPALSVEQRLAIIERAQARQSSLPAVPAAAIPVTNCNDAGPGSYRQAMLNAVSGDTIDMTSIGCSVITLTTGNVNSSANNLTLQGPGQLSLTINGNDTFSQVRHYGSGVMTIRDLTLISGSKYVSAASELDPVGGCVSSQGTLVLINAGAKYCEVRSPRAGVGMKGGGLYSKFGTELLRSVIAGNRALLTGSNGKVAGGGVFSGQRINMTDSTVTGNQAEATGGNSPAVAGGISVGGTGLVAGLGGN